MTSQSKFIPRNGWTKQAIIDHMKKEFKGKSVALGDVAGPSNCKYRTAEGRKCAVGMFIPDAKYTPDMDDPCAVPVSKNGTGVKTLFQVYPDVAALFPLDENPLTMLQRVHDDSWGCPEERTDAQILAELIGWIEQNVA